MRANRKARLIVASPGVTVYVNEAEVSLPCDIAPGDTVVGVAKVRSHGVTVQPSIWIAMEEA